MNCAGLLQGRVENPNEIVPYDMRTEWRDEDGNWAKPGFEDMQPAQIRALPVSKELYPGEFVDLAENAQHLQAERIANLYGTDGRAPSPALKQFVKGAFGEVDMSADELQAAYEQAYKDDFEAFEEPITDPQELVDAVNLPEKKPDEDPDEYNFGDDEEDADYGRPPEEFTDSEDEYEVDEDGYEASEYAAEAAAPGEEEDADDEELEMTLDDAREIIAAQRAERIRLLGFDPYADEDADGDEHDEEEGAEAVAAEGGLEEGEEEFVDDDEYDEDEYGDEFDEEEESSEEDIDPEYIQVRMSFLSLKNKPVFWLLFQLIFSFQIHDWQQHEDDIQARTSSEVLIM